MSIDKLNQEEVLDNIAEYFDLETDDREDLIFTGKTPYGYGLVVEVPGEGEYYAFSTTFDASREAEDYVQEMLEEDPYLFNQDWLQAYLKVSPTDIRLIANDEWNMVYEDALHDGEPEEVAEQLAEDASDAVKKRLKTDLVGYMEELGYDKEWPSWAKVDYRKAARDAVYMDGIGHFLAAYDGDEVDVEDVVLYRQN